MPRDFELQIGRVAQVLEIRAEVVVKKIGLDLFSDITKRNPVDTGRSRASWNIGIDAPVDTVIEPKGSEVLPPPSATGAMSTLGKADVLKSQIYITNAVPYVKYLEGGSSQQAPAGMVRVAVEAMVVELDKVVEQAAKDNPL